MTFGDSIYRSDGHSVARLELFTSCHYGCLGDHEGMGANRWAPSHDSVGEALF